MNDNSYEAGCFIVGEGVSIKGDFSVPNRAVINGTLDGQISAAELSVGVSGKVTGKVTAEAVDVYGEINDTLIASRSLILRSSGKANGSIEYAQIEVEKGAQLRGALKMVGDTPASSDGRAARREAPAAPEARPAATNGANGARPQASANLN